MAPSDNMAGMWDPVLEKGVTRWCVLEPPGGLKDPVSWLRLLVWCSTGDGNREGFKCSSDGFNAQGLGVTQNNSSNNPWSSLASSWGNESQEASGQALGSEWEGSIEDQSPRRPPVLTGLAHALAKLSSRPGGQEPRTEERPGLGGGRKGSRESWTS